LKNKIYLILIVCLLGIYWDDLASKIARLEFDVRDNYYYRSRLTRVEQKAERIALLEAKTNEVEQKLALLKPVQAKNDFTAQRLALGQSLLEKTALAESEVKVFRTTQNADRVENASIGSNPVHRKANWGGHNFFRVGSVAPENSGRTLIKFNELTPEFLAGKKILAAVIYMKQKRNDSDLEDNAAANETIDLYAVRKKWLEGSHIRGKAQKGEVTWISARAGIEDWSMPGCSSPTDDFDPVLLGTTGPVVSGDATEWVLMMLNSDGIKRLLDKSWPNNGYLLRMRDESKSNSAVFFDSDKGFQNNIPYMEIYYQDK
jgi:hypothetical protein